MSPGEGVPAGRGVVPELRRRVACAVYVKTYWIAY